MEDLFGKIRASFLHSLMPTTDPVKPSLNILVIGMDAGILQVVLRLLNDYQQANYHAVGATGSDQARELFAGGDIDLVLMTNGIDATMDATLREEFLRRKPNTRILQHYGGGSGLLFAEIAQAIQ
jgi:hypothetical protein